MHTNLRFKVLREINNHNMKYYSLKILFLLFLIFAAIVIFITYRSDIFSKKSAAPRITESGSVDNAANESASNNDQFPLHRNIQAALFWIGQTPTAENDNVDTVSSTWIKDWVGAYGGVDTPDQRNGWLPAAFTPKENPFYVALPYSDYSENGKIKQNINRSYWFKDSVPTGGSIVKNQWVKIMRLGKVVYAQWEDTAQDENNDVEYVFGESEPKTDVGIRISPAVADYLRIPEGGTVSWQFVDAGEIPEGPWSEILTKTGPDAF